MDVYVPFMQPPASSGVSYVTVFLFFTALLYGCNVK
jgi:hypothetical protein